ncbi:MAG: alanine--glyoxylate aminotransferase family protein [candidate division Zixibacteria bacterium]|nr:alanine--glyoxylate aminotransferase family protein [candidate division Zixibacteria bacterium]
MEKNYGPLNPGKRMLMGPGPSDMHPRVYQALITPLVGHLDPYFIQVMDETKELLRYVFQTRNEFTLPVSGTGSAGMETCVCNLIEPGDTVLICVGGYFGDRMAQMVERHGGRLVRLENEWGRPFTADQVNKALKENAAKVVGIVHAETSTGVLQPLEDIGRVVHGHDALFLVDTVASLGGVSIPVDEWGIDACYTGSQKCLSCPPGLAPITLNDRAVERIVNRKTPVGSWYLDMSMVKNYWGGSRVYHHTAPVTMIYALREALVLMHEEGLENGFARHALNYRAFRAGIDAMGLKFFVEEAYRAPMINPVLAPDGIDEAKARAHLLKGYGIEVGGGLGALRGKAWRVGLMGQSSQKDHVLLFLGALEEALLAQGFRTAGSGTAAAAAVYAG